MSGARLSRDAETNVTFWGTGNAAPWFGDQRRATISTRARSSHSMSIAARKTPGADHIGELQAWNVDTGKKVWATNLPPFNWGPVLATGGDVLFAGGTNDRMFRAFDAKTGKILWEFPTISGRSGAGFIPGRRQAVHRGAIRLGVYRAKMQARMNLLFPADIPRCRRAARSMSSR
jgi:outer membrane protein assembly factor BamB